MATPPSSFPMRAVGSETKYGGHLGDIFDEDNLRTTAEIRQEILTVEAEARRLMDAFNGLELTTLARVQRRHGRLPLENTRGEGSSWTLVPDGRSQRRVVIADSDVVSVKSGMSGVSMPRSTYSGRKTVRPKASLNALLSLNSTSRAGSLHRKNSASSFTSQEWKVSRGGNSVPPVPALPATYGHLGVAMGSNPSLLRSTGNLPMTAVPEDWNAMSGTTVRGYEEEEGQVTNDMGDIQRRREEVRIRYEARLEYLRAKLKGAQLHEKLLKK